MTVNTTVHLCHATMDQAPADWGGNFTKTIHQSPNSTVDPGKVTLPDGFTVVVTGAGKGLGEYIAKAYVQARASAIIITSRTASDLDRVKGELEKIASDNGQSLRVFTIVGDASKEEHYREIKHVLEAKHGSRLDCLINNAGTIGSYKGFTERLTDTSSEDMKRMIDLNYLGPCYSMQYLIPLMLNKESSGKTIVNITSMAAHGSRGLIGYGTSKIALNRVTQHVGESFAEEGLVCVALHPGGVLSDSGQKMPESFQASK